MTAQDVVGFWTSLITSGESGGLAEQLHSLMKVTDEEERALLIVSRAMFLFTMGIKQERNLSEIQNRQLQNKLLKIYENKDSLCSTCLEKIDIESFAELDKENFISKDLECEDKFQGKSKEDNFVLEKENKRPLVTRISNNEKKTKHDTKRPHLSSLSSNIQNKTSIFCYKSNQNINSRPSVLAPETQVVSEPLISKCDRNIIPETIPINHSQHDDDDFFDISSTSSSEDKLSSSISRTCVELDAPNKSTSSPNNNKTSPIVGKPHKNPQHCNMPVSKLLFDSPPMNIQTSTKKSASILNTNKISTTSNCDEDKENNTKSKLPLIEPPITLSSDASPVLDIEVQTSKKEPLDSNSSENRKKRKISDIQFLSTRNLSSKVKSVKLNRSHSTITNRRNEISKSSKYEVTFESPDSKQSKNFRQIKITSQLCAKPEDKTVESIGDDELRKALNESLKTKELEDMMRNKEEELLETFGTSNSSTKKVLPTFTNKINKAKKLSITKSRMPTPCLDIKPSTSSNNHIRKEEKDELLSEGAIMDLIEQDSQEFEEKVKAKSNLQITKKIKKSVSLNDSFDMPVRKIIGQDGKAVHKQWERKQMEGWQCRACQDYYKGRDMTDQQIKELQNKCSRHRSHYNPISNTPKGFWNPDFDDTDVE